MSVANTHFGAHRIGELLRSSKSIYFIGIGGINMSSLAHIAQKRGFRTAGSDRTKTELTERLSRFGIEINYSHAAENLKGFDAVVYTVAISEDNPEYVEAKRRGIPCISRADFLGYIMSEYPRRIGISGTHGKSTCTSMCAETFIRAGVSPTVLSGAELTLMGGAYTVGDGDDFIFEACEYMDSFLDFYPSVAVILNIDLDHVDYFKSLDQMKRSFTAFAAKTGVDGYAIANIDDQNVRDALAEYSGTLLSFGIDSEDAIYRATDIRCARGRYSFTVTKHGSVLCEVSLSVTGYHNIYDALACAAAADLAGLSPDDISRGLAAFRGAKRRMEFRGELLGAELFEDYGHHPTEIRTTLDGARGLADGGRLICVFQPHTYSRTAALFSDFVSSLSVADHVIVSDIYAAREIDTGVVSSKMLADAIGERAIYGGDVKETADVLRAELRAGDVAVIMGAGNITDIFKFLI